MRLPIIGVLLCYGLGVTACKPADVSKQSITLWLAESPQTVEYMNKMARSFEAEHPHWRVRIATSPFADLKPRLLGSQANSHEPDVVLMVNDWIGELVQRKWLAPADLTPADFLPGAIQGVTYQQHRYGYPFSVETTALIRNTRLLPQAPKTWPQWLAASQALKKHQKYPLLYDNHNFYYHSAWLLGFGATILNPTGQLDLQPQPLTQSFDFARSLLQTWQMVPTQTSYGVMLNLFNGGQVGMIIAGPWVLAEIKPSGVPFATSLLPKLPNGQAPRSWLGIKTLGVNRSSQNREGAHALAQYLSSQRAQRKAIQTLGSISARSDLAQANLYPKEMQGFLAQIATSVPMPVWPAMAPIWQEGNWALRQLFDQPISSQALATHLLAKIKTRLKTP